MSDTLCLTPPSASPAMLSDWRDRRLEALNAATPSVSSFLADQLVELMGTSGPMPLHIASLGGSLPDAEFNLWQALRSRGFEEVRIDVLDASESSAEARRCVVEKAGLEESIRIQVGDLTDWDINPALQVFLVSDVLFAQTDPNAVLEQICARLPGHGVLLFVGHIGSGPIQLSETALKRFEDLWELMPARLSEREAFQKAPEVGDDGGFLIPLQPTAPLLQSRFNARALVGFGHLADLVVGPERGFELMPEDPDARQFVEAVQAIDESRITTESLPPRHGVGVFVTGPCEAPLRLGLAWPRANADA
jgi:SAM-dependent methyltransferase